ncbi:MAG: ABC-2 transporter permease [Propionibacteriaceae bacterium]|nr:ABC-2 transporter permease [Propionibacteriaceae bacterium]
MRRIWNTFRLEFYTAKSVYPLLLVGLVIAGLLGIVRKPYVAALPIMVFAMFFGGTIWSIHERNHSDKLFGVLPLRRNDVVIGRYMYGLAMGLFNLILGTIAIYVMWKATSADMTVFTYLAALSAGWLFYCLAVSISYPIYTRLSFSQAYIFTMLPFMILVIVCVYVLFKGNLEAVKQAFNYIIIHPVIMGCSAFGIGLLLLIVSCIISMQLYRTKELS